MFLLEHNLEIYYLFKSVHLIFCFEIKVMYDIIRKSLILSYNIKIILENLVLFSMVSL